MYEIDLSTLMLIGDNDKTKIITIDNDFICDYNSLNIIDNSCKFFGGSLKDNINKTNRLANIFSKTPIIIEETRNIIFFPLYSTREKNNIWISFNNLDKYQKKGKCTELIFKCGKRVVLDFSYYIIDNQVTRSLMLDYYINYKRKSLEK